ncbi:MAG: N-acetylneuraminate synthase [Planctomycetes bacterium]|nr:N-acetylneuraminate synthase [Planctomycetota bacterium]
MKIGDRPIDLDHRPYVVAEIGVNHDGSSKRAVELTDAAADAGADAIKVQLFEADRLLSSAARLAAYQERAGAKDPGDLLRALELGVGELAGAVERAHERGLHAIVTVFSVELVAPAFRIPFDAGKTASTDIINRPLIEAMLDTGRPLLTSTGAATCEEVAAAVEWMAGRPHLLLHCVSSYPTTDEDAALGGRIALERRFPEALGYSDHTTSTDTGALAVAGGACLLEKHLTWSREAAGPDHAASLEPDGMAEYVRLAHRAWRMRGPIVKSVSAPEREVRAVSRQSLTTTRALPRGHRIQRSDLTIKRPGTGLSPAVLERIAGRVLARQIEADVPLTEDHLV